MTHKAAPNEYLKFFNGQLYPALGYGTWQAKDEELEAALEIALETGYRHIDTAFAYNNERVIGNVLKRWISSGKVKRGDIFLVTKLPTNGNSPEGVKLFIQKSLEALQTDYVDLYLIHCPVGLKYVEGNPHPKAADGKSDIDFTTDHIAIWKAMEELVDNGKARSIGLSNFNIAQITKILQNARIQPANLQIELHAHHQQNELVDFCKKNNIVVTAYSPLANPSIEKILTSVGVKKELPNVLGDPVVTALGKKYNKTPAQIILRHIVQRGIAAIPKSTNPQRIKENIDIFDFKLDDTDMKQMNALDKCARIVTFSIFKGFNEHPEYPFPELKGK